MGQQILRSRRKHCASSGSARALPQEDKACNTRGCRDSGLWRRTGALCSARPIACPERNAADIAAARYPAGRHPRPPRRGGAGGRLRPAAALRGQALRRLPAGSRASLAGRRRAPPARDRRGAAGRAGRMGALSGGARRPRAGERRVPGRRVRCGQDAPAGVAVARVAGAARVPELRRAGVRHRPAGGGGRAGGVPRHAAGGRGRVGAGRPRQPQAGPRLSPRRAGGRHPRGHDVQHHPRRAGPRPLRPEELRAGDRGAVVRLRGAARGGRATTATAASRPIPAARTSWTRRPWPASAPPPARARCTCPSAR